MSVAAIGLGSNVGDAGGNVRRAIRALRALGNVSAVSRLYRSKAWGVTDQPDFINAAALLATHIPPDKLLEELQAIEHRLGRVPTYRWGPRVIDLDLRDYADVRMDRDGLTLPHPQLLERPFVVVPLADIDKRYEAAAAQVDAENRPIALDE